MSEKNIQAERVAFLEELGFNTIRAETEARILEVLRDLKAQNDAMIREYKVLLESHPNDPQITFFQPVYDKAVQDNERIAVLLQQTQ